jgi:methyl-accepting chemotaxis protein
MNNKSIVRRIVIGLTALLMVTCALVGFVRIRVATLGSEAEEMRSTTIPSLLHLSTVQRVAEENQGIVYKHIFSPSSDDRRELEVLITANSKENAAALDAFGKLRLSEATRRAFEQTSTNRTKLIALRNEILAASRSAKTPEETAAVATRARTEFDPVIRAYLGEIKSLTELERQQSTSIAETMLLSVRDTNLGMLVATGLALLGSVVIGILIIGGVNRVMRSTTDTLTTGSEQIVAAAQKVSNSSQGLAEGASAQAASIDQTGASIEELKGMTTRNASGANQAKEIAESARRSADESSVSVTKLNTAMEELKVSSAEVAKIVKTIDEIAFQTNILALNAAVEAARAGESGAGFAVVAEEVRNLAQRSAQAAKETAEKIEKALAKSEEGVRIGSEVSTSLGGIADKVRKLDGLITDIALGSSQQSKGIEEVTDSIKKIDQVTQANAAVAQESAGAARELNAQAVALNALIGNVLKLVGGRRQFDELGRTGALKPGGRRARDTGAAHAAVIPGPRRGAATLTGIRS